MATKTKTIGLNQYVGSDYVKMADFNADNLAIDNAFKEDRAKMKQIEDNVNGMELVDSKIRITDKQGHFTGETLDVVLDEIDDKIKETRNKIDEKLKITYSEVTLEASSWSEQTYSLEATYPSTVYDLEVELSGNATKELAKVWSRAIPVESPDGKNIIKLLGIVPSVNIPVRVKAVKK